MRSKPCAATRKRRNRGNRSSKTMIMYTLAGGVVTDLNLIRRILKNKQEEPVIPAKTEMTIKIVWFISTIIHFT